MIVCVGKLITERKLQTLVEMFLIVYLNPIALLKKIRAGNQIR